MVTANSLVTANSFLVEQAPDEIEAHRVADLFCNAFEGGSGFWMDFVETRGVDLGLPIEISGMYGEYPAYWAALVSGGMLVILDKITNTRHTVTRASVHRALQLMKEKHPGYYREIKAEEDDASTADVFMQLCAFGEVLYA